MKLEESSIYSGIVPENRAKYYRINRSKEWKGFIYILEDIESAYQQVAMREYLEQFKIIPPQHNSKSVEGKN